MAYTEDELYNMSDEELEAAARDVEVDDNSVDTNYEEKHAEEPEVEDTEGETEEVTDGELEQPTDEEDSADQEDTDNNDDGSDDETEEPADEEGEPEVEEVTEVDSADKKNDDEAKEVQRLKFKANGQEFEFTEDEIKAQFGKVFGQAMNYTQKMQAIAPYRKMISALEEEKLTEDDMNLMIDALKGNKDAITSLVKRANVDVLDLDLESDTNYVPNDYGRNESELQLQEVIGEISKDPEFAVTQSVLAEQWDDASRTVFAEQPELIKELHIDVLNGTFDKVSPMAMKMKVMDGGQRSDLDYYVAAGKQYHAQQRSAELAEQARLQQEAEQARIAEAEQAQKARETVKVQSSKRKAAAPTNTRSGKKKVVDYWEDSDEAFEEWYAKLQDSM